jgi:RnfABCDGE-type electron transport complex D subunit
VAIGVAFGVIFGKELFGGTGRNLYNPALVGRCFLALGYPVALSTGWIQPAKEWGGRIFQYIDITHIDAITNATPLGRAKHGDLESITNLFTGNVTGCIGETSALLIIAGGIFLCMTKVASFRTVTAIIAGSAIMQGFLHWLSPAAYASALWHIGAGGLLFGAFFMATDPVTSPLTNAGKWIYGFIIGIVTILIRNLTGYVEGMMFAILFGNTIAPLIDELVQRYQLKRLALHEA